MPKQTVRQQARRVALDAQTRARQRRTEQDRRRSALALTVVTALAERDAHVRACETRAGEALRALTDVEGLTTTEVLEWCGDAVTRREVSRLKALEQVPTVSTGSDPTDVADSAEADKVETAAVSGGSVVTVAG